MSAINPVIQTAGGKARVAVSSGGVAFAAVSFGASGWSVMVWLFGSGRFRSAACLPASLSAVPACRKLTTLA